MIPEGTPMISVIVKNGKGGPNKDGIPIYDRIPPGSRIGYLKNDAVIKIVDPSSPNAIKYRELWNKSMWVEFQHPALKEDCYCEEDGKRTIQLLKLIS